MSTHRIETLSAEPGSAEPGSAEFVGLDLIDYPVGPSPSPAVIGDDPGGRLVRLGPYVGIGVVLVERNRVALSPERFAEPAVFDARQVFHEPEQVRPRGSHGPAKLVLVEPFQLPQHHVTVPVEARVEALLLPTGGRHPSHSAILVGATGLEPVTPTLSR